LLYADPKSENLTNNQYLRHLFACSWKR